MKKMKPRSIVPRIVSLLLCLALALPSPALALRQTGLEESDSTKGELVAALTGTPKLPITATAPVPVVEPDMIAAGLEEGKGVREGGIFTAGLFAGALATLLGFYVWSKPPSRPFWLEPPPQPRTSRPFWLESPSQSSTPPPASVSPVPSAASIKPSQGESVEGSRLLRLVERPYRFYSLSLSDLVSPKELDMLAGKWAVLYTQEEKGDDFRRVDSSGQVQGATGLVYIDTKRELNWRKTNKAHLAIFENKGDADRAPDNVKEGETIPSASSSLDIPKVVDGVSPVQLVPQAREIEVEIPDPGRRRALKAFIEGAIKQSPPDTKPKPDTKGEGDTNGNAPEKPAGLEEVLVYLNPEIKDGRLVGEPEPYDEKEVRNIPNLWAHSAVQKVAGTGGTIAFGNYPVLNSGGKMAFGFMGRHYTISRPFAAGSESTRLLVVVRVQPGQRPQVTAVHDQSTGQFLIVTQVLDIPAGLEEMVSLPQAAKALKGAKTLEIYLGGVLSQSVGVAQLTDSRSMEDFLRKFAEGHDLPKEDVRFVVTPRSWEKGTYQVEIQMGLAERDRLLYSYLFEQEFWQDVRERRKNTPPAFESLGEDNFRRWGWRNDLIIAFTVLFPTLFETPRTVHRSPEDHKTSAEGYERDSKYASAASLRLQQAASYIRDSYARDDVHFYPRPSETAKEIIGEVVEILIQAAQDYKKGQSANSIGGDRSKYALVLAANASQVVQALHAAYAQAVPGTGGTGTEPAGMEEGQEFESLEEFVTLSRTHQVYVISHRLDRSIRLSWGLAEGIFGENSGFYVSGPLSEQNRISSERAREIQETFRGFDSEPPRERENPFHYELTKRILRMQPDQFADWINRIYGTKGNVVLKAPIGSPRQLASSFAIGPPSDDARWEYLSSARSGDWMREAFRQEWAHRLLAMHETVLGKAWFALNEDADFPAWIRSSFERSYNLAPDIPQKVRESFAASAYAEKEIWARLLALGVPGAPTDHMGTLFESLRKHGGSSLKEALDILERARGDLELAMAEVWLEVEKTLDDRIQVIQPAGLAPDTGAETTELQEPDPQKARAELWRFLANPEIQRTIQLLGKSRAGREGAMMNLAPYFAKASRLIHQAGYPRQLLNLIELGPPLELEDGSRLRLPAGYENVGVPPHKAAIFVEEEFSEAVKKNLLSPAPGEDNPTRFVDRIEEADLVIGDRVTIRPQQTLLEVNSITAPLVTHQMLHRLQGMGLLVPGAVVKLHDIIKDDLGEGVLIFA